MTRQPGRLPYNPQTASIPSLRASTVRFSSFLVDAVRWHQHQRVAHGPRQQAVRTRRHAHPRAGLRFPRERLALSRVSHQFDPRDEPALADFRDVPQRREPCGEELREMFDLPTQPPSTFSSRKIARLARAAAQPNALAV